MFIAMNRFTVTTENADAFEALWLDRDSHLKMMDEFVAFHMLKGPEANDGTRLYASHTVWASETAFRAWTRSDAFRAAHKGAGQTAKLHVGSPTFEGFSVIQEINA
ncbi:antibiotic biosynthesis monooxygenase [uncultured Tateyamaria sp.]|uniref:antibiotic biosynthesis monooxygenase family protein n=1 Tax=Tateyamaria sp. 1078 TaxID=3417464 RepID=UPI002611110F|nr:antibiotic biosynthesis monooxygenase [uncultured Tateyamaria sp.]